MRKFAEVSASRTTQERTELRLLVTESRQKTLKLMPPGADTSPVDEHLSGGNTMTPASRTSQRQTERRLLVVGSRQAEVEALTLIRCPACHKMLAKCDVRGMIEIACPRCKTLVRNTFT